MTDTATQRGTLAGAVAAAAVATPGVARLVGTARGVEIATHYPGGRVVGVALTPEAVAVHLAVDRLPVQSVAVAVARAVRPVMAAAGDGRRVDVVVEDVTDAAFTALDPADGGGR